MGSIPAEVYGPYALLVFLLVFVVYGGRKEWWLFGWVHRELLAAERRRAEAAEAREAEWKSYAMRGIQATEDATDVVRRVVEAEDP